MWVYVLAVGGGPIAVLATVLAWRDHRTRRSGGQIDYLTPNALDARRGGPGQPPAKGYPVFGSGGGEVLPPTDP